jgi:hypothetical protein
MSQERVEQHNANNRIESMTLAQIEQQRERHRVYNLTCEQLQRKRESNLRQSNYFKKVEQEWYDERPCPYCFYVALKSQRINWNQKYPSPCCHNGLYLDPNSGFPQLNVLPPVLKELCLTRGDHFGKFSAKYNKILCIGSTGVENSHNGGFEQIAGDHAVKMNGRSYHFLSKDIAKVKGGINYFTFDGIDNATAHLSELNGPELALATTRSTSKQSDKLESFILKKIFNELKDINEFVQELSMIGGHLKRRGEEAQMGNGFSTAAEQILDLEVSLNSNSNFVDVGCIMSDDSDGPIQYKYQLTVKGKKESSQIPSYSDTVEPLCYTLLFPFGEKGWYKNLERDKGISFFNYMRSRFKMPERTYDTNSDPLLKDDRDMDSVPYENKLLRQYTTHSKKLLATNRFQLCHRLSQYYLVEGLSRNIDFKIKWQKYNRQYMFGTQAQHAQEAETEHHHNDNGGDGGVVADDVREEQEEQGDVIEDNNDHGEAEEGHNSNSGGERSSGTKKANVTYLSPSLHGSPRHLTDLARNALTIVEELGSPDFFITGTTNPLWPEIQDRLFTSQNAFDRPDIVVEVFHARLEALIHNIRRGKYFGGRETRYDLRVIEYQHRGLPHFHMVVKLKDLPDRQFSQDIVEMIDE